MMTRFNVGDKVVVIPSALDSILLQKYGLKPGIVYTVIAFMNSEQHYLLLDGFKPYLHHSYFDFYKEEKDMTSQATQQTQQKTKRVPFTHELWEKWKDKGGEVVYKRTGKQVLQFAYFPDADHRYRCAYLTLPGTSLWTSNIDEIELEIPVTTKRIPFNLELKDAKVFIKYGNVPVDEWYWFSNNITAVLTNGKRIDAKFPAELEMEIEEDV